MTKEEADYCQRFNIPVIRNDVEEQEFKFIKEFRRWRTPWNKEDFSYSVSLENRNLPRNGVVVIGIDKCSVAPGFDALVKSRLQESSDQKQFEEFKRNLLQ